MFRISSRNLRYVKFGISSSNLHYVKFGISSSRLCEVWEVQAVYVKFGISSRNLQCEVWDKFKQFM